jgi:hypothetical protein
MHYIEWPIFWGGILKALDINNGYLTHLINLLVSLRYFPILNSLTYSCISWFKISKYRMPFILRNDLIRWIKCKSLYCRFFCLKSSFDRINAVHRLPIYSIKETGWRGLYDTYSIEIVDIIRLLYMVALLVPLWAARQWQAAPFWGLYKRCGRPEPTSQDAKPRVQPGVHPPFYITTVGGEPRVNPGFWLSEMWAQGNAYSSPLQYSAIQNL